MGVNSTPCPAVNDSKGPRLDDVTARRLEAMPLMMMWALHWAAQGWPVLPCKPEDKSPYITKGKLNASTDPARVIAWWRQFPDAMIGGRTDGKVVLDHDAYKRGHGDDLAWLEAQGRLPPTRTFSTPGRDGKRGTHRVYLDPDGECRSTKLGRNGTIDVRAGTSADYIILPPSRNSSGEVYAITSWRLPARVPTWCAKAAGSSPVTAQAQPGGELAREPLPERLPRLIRLALDREVDPDKRSEHSQYLVHLAHEASFSDEQIATLLDLDKTTQERRAEPRRNQPGWADKETRNMIDEAESKDDGKKPSGSVVLLRIARDRYRFGMTTDRVPFAVAKDGPKVVNLFRGSRTGLRSQLAGLFERAMGRPPTQNALSEALQVLDNEAQEAAVRDGLVKMPLRFARHGGELVLDLGRPDGKAVVVGPGTWKVVDESPVLFTRTELTASLPDPLPGGRLADTLYPLLNLTRPDKDLMLAVILSWLWPDIAHPVVYLVGPEGTAKSTMAATARRLMDPSVVELRRQPGRDEDFEICVAGQQVVVLDNMSKMDPWLSDAICTVVTGIGDVKRKKYADQELSVVEVRRSFILTSIVSIVSQGDLWDRTFLLEPQPLGAVRSDIELRREREESWPQALGAILDLACKVLAVLPDVVASGIASDQRLRDFGDIAAAMDRVLGTHVLDTIRQKVKDATAEALQADPFVAALAAHVLNLMGGYWEASAALVYDVLVVPNARKWGRGVAPENALKTGNRIRRAIGTLRKVGIEATHQKREKGNVWLFEAVQSRNVE